MATVDLTGENFEETVRGEGIVLVDFWSAASDPSREFWVFYEELATHHEDICFAKVDGDTEAEIVEAFQLESLPALVVFRDGVILYRGTGALTQESLEEVIAKAREVDMAALKAQLEKKKPKKK